MARIPTEIAFADNSLEGAFTPESHLRKDIQGLRAVAVLLVVFFHTDLLVPGGFVGVDIFFVISGFVITGILRRDFKRSSTHSLRNFYARRVRRLLPALSLMLAFVAVGSFLLQSPLGLQQVTAQTGTATSFFISNVQLILISRGYFAGPAADDPLLHTWTLAVEEQFYLFFPALLLIIWRFPRWASRETLSMRSSIITVLVVLIGSFVIEAFVTSSTGFPFGTILRNREVAFYLSPMRAWEFAIGSLLVLLNYEKLKGQRRIALVCGFLGCLLVCAAALFINSNTPFPGTAVLLPVMGATLLIFAGTMSSNPVSTFLALRPMVWVGDISYGWYLWHWPFIVFVQSITRVFQADTAWIRLLAATAALMPAWLSYRYLEDPIRRNRSFVGWRAVRLAVACMSVPVLLFLGLLISAQHPGGVMRNLEVQYVPHADQARGCLENLPGNPRTGASCTWNVPRSRGNVVLIGDSNAGQFAEPVARAANRLHFSLTLATFGGCPFADVETHLSVLELDGACRHFVSTWMRTLTRSRPAMVVIGNLSPVYIRSDQFRFESIVNHRSASDVRGKEALWQEGMTRTLRRLTTAGVPVLVVHTIPQFSAFLLSECPAVVVYVDEAACGRHESRQYAEEFNRPALLAEQRALHHVAGARGINFINDLCTPHQCSTNLGSAWIYRDGEHLSVRGALALTGRFQHFIQMLARPRSTS